MLTFPHQTERENVDGQEKSEEADTQRAAAAKKPPRRRNHRRAKASARKAAAKSTARNANSRARAARGRRRVKRARPKQRIAISHYRDEDFKADGLRAYAHYRDLGIAEASHGLAQAHVIRLIGPCNPAEVSKLHFHDVDFQMVYVLKGWVKTYMEGQGETMMQRGQLPGPSRRGSSI